MPSPCGKRQTGNACGSTVRESCSIKYSSGPEDQGGVGRTEERRWLRWSDRTENRLSEESLEKIQEHMGCKSAGIGRVLSVLQKAAEQQQRSSLDLNCKPVTGLRSDARRYGESGVKYQGQL
jgi:hypothetical protein